MPHPHMHNRVLLEGCVITATLCGFNLRESAVPYELQRGFNYHRSVALNLTIRAYSLALQRQAEDPQISSTRSA